jgi:hypothetical protein
MSIDVATTTRTAIYKGRRRSNKDKVMYVWAFMLEDGTGAEDCAYDKLIGRNIGGTYTVEVNEEGSVYPATLTYKGSAADGGRFVVTTPQELEEWTTLDRVEATQVEQIMLDKRIARGDDAFTDLCAPLRERYHKTIGHTRKAALLAAMIEEVTRY